MARRKRPRRRKLKKSAIVIMIVFMMVIGGGAFFIADFFEGYNNPPIIGEWVSEDTGKVVEFKSNGLVKVDGEKAGTYEITSPALITYEIEGHTFHMPYAINERHLVWGLPGEEENFERKGL